MANKFFKYLCFIFIFCITFNVYALEEDELNNENILTEYIMDDNEIQNNNENTQSEYIMYNNAYSDNEYKYIIEDDADLLSESQRAILIDEMAPLSKYGNIIFKTINENNSTTKSYASNYYHNNFGTESGTVFLIDMDNREIYIFSDGNNYTYITSDKAYSITDNVYRYASDGNYYECARKAFSQIKDVLEGRKISEPMRYISNAFIAITLASFINFFIVMFHSKIKTSKDKEIISNCKINFEIGEIGAHKTGTKRVYSPQSDGGSSGGGGGGGGSSGGGGGHGF